MSRQNSDPIALIPTISDDDNDVPDLDGPDDDDDNDDEMIAKARAHKLAQATKGKSLDFNEQFQFLLDDPEDKRLIKHRNDNDDQLKTRGELSNIDEKIAEVRSRRKKKNKPDTEEENTTTNTIEDEAFEMEVEHEPISDKVKTKESKKKKSKDKKKDEFFEESPPFNPDQVFSEMKISRPLLKALSAIGLHSPTPIQAATVPLALLGRDVCACAVTGSGKTIAFALPIVERLLYKPHQTAPCTRVLVLAPTRELCVQIHQVFRQLSQFAHNITSCLSTGGLDLKSQEASLRLQPDIVIATPGRLIDHIHNSPTFTLQNIEILVLDEADRMLDEYYFEQMKEVITNCSRTRQTMLFSATMTDQIKDLIQVSLNRPIRLFIDDNQSVAPYLRQEFIRIREHREGDREAIIAALLTRTFHDRVIVFAQTKKQCHRMHVMLGLLGLKIGELHGDLNQTQRLDTLRRFKNEEIDVLLATDLAARGLDIENVKTVINFVLPNTLKHYIHRVGRTARAGKTGRSISLVGENERHLLKDILKTCKVPAKMRIIPQEIVQIFRNKLEELEPDIEEILKMEYGDKMLQTCEAQIDKAEKRLKDSKTDASNPKREWFQNRNERIAEQDKLRLDPHSNKKKKVSKEEREQIQKMKSTPKTADDRVKFEMQKVARFQTRQTNGSSSKRPRDSSSFETDLTIDKPQWRSKSTPPAASAPTKKSKR
ncbi:unnamed protein product [Rotaria magnacalcarata]|uniref:RNA helicase n=11 Tax=Rotaria TaxID=231623 RepID=A0A816QTF1_9BILA|nr:unnamed protein product [Rotaria magnacalcarata]CAF1681191.1 unnamed protein product [Rotaria magnacalcarata]CAF2062991.1 unnamed protein product [Rotaria magnacalcarata]CAF2110057.1 unnamed protein product [Rotaria magnacalcarata]CAF2231281.1 unnamed protein product [Rotaria magnacalcarata]